MVLINVEPLPENNKPRDGVNTIFSPLFFGMRLFGFYIPWSDARNFKKYSSICYCVAINILILVNVIRYVTVFFNEQSLTGTMTSSLATFTFFLSCCYLSGIMSLIVPKSLTSWIKDVYSYHQDFGSSIDYKRMKKIIIKSLVFVSVVAVVISFVFMFSDSMFELFSRHLSPCGYLSGHNRRVCNGFVSLGILFSVERMYVIVISFSCISYCLYKDLKVLSERFNQEMKDNVDQLEDVVLRYHTRHERMCDLVRDADKMVSHIAFSAYAFGIPMICFFLYGSIRGSVLEEIGYSSVTLVGIVFFMIHLTLFSSVVSQKAHEPLTHIFHCDWLALSDTAVNKVNLFVSRLTSERIGFTVYGLFTIDRSTILMITGTLLTYVVVVLQIPAGVTDCSAICRLQLNNTNP